MDNVGVGLEGGLPPLDAGANVPVFAPLSIDKEEIPAPPENAPAPSETAPESPAQEPKSPVEKPEAPTSPEPDEDADDDEVLNALMGKDEGAKQEPVAEESKAPEGVPEEMWNKFQEWQKQQEAQAASEASKAEPSAQAPVPDVPVPKELEITQADWDEAFDSYDKFKSVMDKNRMAAIEHARRADEEMRDTIYDEVDKGIVKVANQLHDVITEKLTSRLTERFETMLHMWDAFKEVPEILTSENYQKAFRIAWNKAQASAKPGDLRGAVEKAMKTFKKEQGRAGKILAQSQNVDVRPRQTPPGGGVNSGRQAFAKPSGSGGGDDGISFLTGLFG